MSKIAIIGAGISGLTAAYKLKSLGHDITLFESQSFPGGVIQTFTDQGFLAELGPNSIRLNHPDQEKFLHELGLQDQIIESRPEAKKRFVVKKRQLVALPQSLLTFLKTPLFSPLAKLRLLKEPFISKPKEDTDQSVADFTKRRLGREFLDYAVNPFVSGIHAGDPDLLSLKHAFPSLYQMESAHGSLFKAFLQNRKKPKQAFKPKIISFINGMATLPKRIAEILGNSLQLNSNITAILPQEGRWHIEAQSPLGSTSETFDKLIVTTPTHSWQKLPFPESIKSTFDPVKNLPYAPIACLTLGFQRNQINHPLDAFGFLVPEVENYSILGTIFSASTFDHRAPEGYTTLTTFFGGSKKPQLIEKTEQEAKALVLKDLKDLIKIQGPPEWSHYTTWSKAIPQYNLGFEHFLNTFDSIEQSNPGLHFLGNFRSGTALPKCIEAGLNIHNTLNL